MDCSNVLSMKPDFLCTQRNGQNTEIGYLHFRTWTMSSGHMKKDMVDNITIFFWFEYEMSRHIYDVAIGPLCRHQQGTQDTQETHKAHMRHLLRCLLTLCSFSLPLAFCNHYHFNLKLLLLSLRILFIDFQRHPHPLPSSSSSFLSQITLRNASSFIFTTLTSDGLNKLSLIHEKQRKSFKVVDLSMNHIAETEAFIPVTCCKSLLTYIRTSKADQ